MDAASNPFDILSLVVIDIDCVTVAWLIPSILDYETVVWITPDHLLLQLVRPCNPDRCWHCYYYRSMKETLNTCWI